MAATILLEEWKPIKEFAGVYAISSLGRVMRVAPGNCTRTGRIRKTSGSLTTAGYEQVMLSCGSIRKSYMIHRLVADAFLPPDPDRRCINHRDGDKTNNRANNLERCTYLENSRHAAKAGLLTGWKNPASFERWRDRERSVSTGRFA